MKFHCITFILLLQGSIALTQDVAVDARSQSLGFAGTMLAKTVTAFSSPASIATVERACLSAHTQSQWGIAEWSSAALSAILPVKNTALAFGYAASGYQAFLESHMRLSAAHAFGKKLDAGISMEYIRIRQTEHAGNLQAFVPALSLQMTPVPAIVVGIHIVNPLKSGYFPSGYTSLPSRISAGIGFSPDPTVLVCLEWSKEWDTKPVYCGGIELAFGKYFRLRTGVSSSSIMQYGMGLGMRVKHVQIDLSATHHAVLGYSPALTMLYFIG